MQKLFDEMICPECERMFICWDRGAWRYKKTINGLPKFWCSYSCFQAFKAKEAEEKEQKRKSRRKKKEG